MARSTLHIPAKHVLKFIKMYVFPYGDEVFFFYYKEKDNYKWARRILLSCLFFFFRLNGRGEVLDKAFDMRFFLASIVGESFGPFHYAYLKTMLCSVMFLGNFRNKIHWKSAHLDTIWHYYIRFNWFIWVSYFGLRPYAPENGPSHFSTINRKWSKTRDVLLVTSFKIVE